MQLITALAAHTLYVKKHAVTRKACVDFLVQAKLLEFQAFSFCETIPQCSLFTEKVQVYFPCIKGACDRGLIRKYASIESIERFTWKNHRQSHIHTQTHTHTHTYFLDTYKANPCTHFPYENIQLCFA